MLTIYDGPFFSEGNVFTQISELANSPDQSGGANGCTPPTKSATKLLTIYDTTQQIAAQQDCNGNVTKYDVPDAAVGWKQTNGFYYPPAFAFKETTFDLDTATYKASRHNVLDQNKTYTTGLSAFPSFMASATLPQIGATPIDVTTILNDLDGSLNGLVPVDVNDPQAATSTQSSGLSNNAFYDAPYSVDECNSVGTTTLPNTFVTSVVAQLDSATPSMTLGTWGSTKTPAVAVYRQLLTGNAGESCASYTNACVPGAADCCRRGTFFMGAYIGQAPGLTMNNGVFYIDTNSQNQTASGPVTPAGFLGGKTYAVYNLYANSDTSVTYQVYVGTGFNLAADFEWILVDPHTLKGAQGQFKVSVNTTPPPSKSAPRGLDNPRYNRGSGMLTVTLAHSNSQQNYTNTITNGTGSDICYPNNLCQTDTQKNQCVLNANLFKESGLEKTIDDICAYWVTRTTQQMTDTQASTASTGTVFLNDCPVGGCLGFAFTLPAGFAPVAYSNKGTAPFTKAQWTTSLQQTPGSSSSCPTPPANGNFPPQKVGRMR